LCDLWRRLIGRRRGETHGQWKPVHERRRDRLPSWRDCKPFPVHRLSPSPWCDVAMFSQSDRRLRQSDCRPCREIAANPRACANRSAPSRL